MRVGELLIPIAEAMRRELVGGSYIQADETTVDVQMHDGRGAEPSGLSPLAAGHRGSPQDDPLLQT
jgi:hypothetical protein